jgi:hypothetical protein
LNHHFLSRQFATLNLVYQMVYRRHLVFLRHVHLVYVVDVDVLCARDARARDARDARDSGCGDEEELYDNNHHSNNMWLMDMVLSDTLKLVRKARILIDQNT